MGAAAGTLALHWMVLALWRIDPWAVPLFLAIPLGFALYGALAVAAAAALRACGVPSLLAMATAITSAHWAWAHQGPFSMPWLTILAPLTGAPVLLQLAHSLGVTVMTGVLALVNALVAGALVRRRSREPYLPLLGAATAGVILISGAGYLVQQQVILTSVGQVGALQTDFGWRAKWDGASRDSVVQYQVKATREGLEHHPRLALVVWPETSLPGYPQQHPLWGSDLLALAGAGAGMVVAGGLVEVLGDDASHGNGVFLADAQRIGPVYAKRQLVPLLERSPRVLQGIGALAWAGRASRGDSGRLLATPVGVVGFAVCHEATFGRMVGEYRRRGATLIVNPSNDAWLAGTLGVRQVEAALVLVAIQHRIAIVRAGNRGRSVILNPLGQRTAGSGTMVVGTVWMAVGRW